MPEPTGFHKERVRGKVGDNPPSLLLPCSDVTVPQSLQRKWNCRHESGSVSGKGAALNTVTTTVVALYGVVILAS